MSIGIRIYNEQLQVREKLTTRLDEHRPLTFILHRASLLTIVS